MVKAFVLAGTHSGVGKTSISIALMSYFKQIGYQVQPFKVGPDYIDPSYHSYVTGRKSRNLDSWLLSEDKVKELFNKASYNADIAIVEGVMGLFDGFGGTSELGSTAHIAKILNLPVILIINGSSMSRSAAALVKGFKDLDPKVNVAGVILNQVGSEGHGNLLREAIESLVGIPVLGILQKGSLISLPSRHLGLIPMSERQNLHGDFQKLGLIIKDRIEIRSLLEIAAEIDSSQIINESFNKPSKPKFKGLRVAVAQDEAFSFYYEDNLEYLRDNGVELEFFSPIHDSKLPSADGYIFGGGFPELYLDALANNLDMKSAIHKANKAKRPIYAECGGFMYLTEAIVNFEGKEYPMVGLLPGKCAMQKKRAALGYYQGKALKDNLLMKAGDRVRGHEFHYSIHLGEEVERDYAFQLGKNPKDFTRLEGYASDNILASYLHLHWHSNENWIYNFLSKMNQATK